MKRKVLLISVISVFLAIISFICNSNVYAGSSGGGNSGETSSNASITDGFVPPMAWVIVKDVQSNPNWDGILMSYRKGPFYRYPSDDGLNKDSVEAAAFTVATVSKGCVLMNERNGFTVNPNRNT